MKKQQNGCHINQKDYSAKKTTLPRGLTLTLTLLYTIFDSQETPFVYLLLTKENPFTHQV